MVTIKDYLEAEENQEADLELHPGKFPSLLSFKLIIMQDLRNYYMPVQKQARSYYVGQGI